MKPVRYKWFLFSGILLVYLFLYSATTRVPPDYPCDEVCEKVQRIDSTLRITYAQTATQVCNTDLICVNVYSSLVHNWANLADSTCMLLNENGLQHYTVAVVQISGAADTLLTQTCP